MRLIDADKLNAVLQNLAGHLAENGDALLAACLIQAQEVVDAQRTVEAEPVVRADWYGVGNMLMCTACEGQVYEPSNYCPNCGAKMGGEDE